jgi:hypothetical protein
MFNQMVNQMLDNPVKIPRLIWITQEEYDQWKQQYLFQALKGHTFGRDFCDHFDILDYILYFSAIEEAEHYILRTYIR